jgi:hypothetical protein
MKRIHHTATHLGIRDRHDVAHQVEIGYGRKAVAD